MTTEATPHSNDRGGGAVTGIDIQFESNKLQI